ncbi:MAG: formate--tetrahydrofolate ligase [Candidatus Omnitrophica bacterium]|nr:formate--tetrahydrofolate ligase [Candidatus Omnitrophota bacterium]
MPTQTERKIPSNIEIAQSARPLQITEIARSAGIRLEELEVYGQYKAKVSLKLLERVRSRPYGRLIVVTAMTPTEAGEGKTSTAIGLTEAMGRLRKKAMLTLREPSIGPIFGAKGGACGSGRAQILPMDDINLHFTGDIHAVGTAHNLLAALVENHVLHGNELGIDPEQIIWRRVSEIPDRNLRHIRVGLGGIGYVSRETGFDITVASEIMAVLALARSFDDLKERLGRMVVAYRKDGSPVTARDVKAVGAMALLMKDAIKPNLVQTLEGQPVFIHTGPFANLAHGANSVLATEMGLRLADYCVTEGGFGTDLGLEKFCHIVARCAGFRPEVAVVVVTVRALKVHGGMTLQEASDREDVRAMQRGFENMEHHLNVVRKLGLVPIVAVNRFFSDSDTELRLLKEHCLGLKIRCAISEVSEKGGEGGIELAKEVLAVLQHEKASHFVPLYPLESTIQQKLDTIAREIYGADGVECSEEALADIQRLTKQGYAGLPINVAKTQLSLSDDPKQKGVPTGWKLKVRSIRVEAGAGFLLALTGKILTMPGLPKSPLAEKLDIDSEGRITGLF